MTHTALLKRINGAYHSKVLGAFQPYIGDLLTLANAQAADIAELVACLRFYAVEWKGNADGDPSEPGLSRSWEEPTDKLFHDAGHNARTLLERIGHEI